MGKEQHSISKADLLTFNIDETARQVGVTPATIRNWEKQKLFVAKRASNGYRVFDFDDIEYLKMICEYSKKQNMSINDIRLLLQNNHGNLLEKRRKKTGVSKILLSRKWKQSRKEQGYRLETVAESVGISAPYLSKIENGHANPSMDILNRLAAFYGQSLLYYLGDVMSESHCVKKGAGQEVEIGRGGIFITSLTALRDFKISSLLYTVKPGCGDLNPTSHSGQEFVYVLAGTVTFTLNGETYSHLGKGDSLSFRSKEPHSWYNSGNINAMLLWIYTPDQ
mgnify:CR=1 FL=1